MSEDSDYERYIREQIAMLQQEYQRAVKPYIDDLVRLESLKPRTITISTGHILGEHRPSTPEPRE